MKSAMYLFLYSLLESFQLVEHLSAVKLVVRLLAANFVELPLDLPPPVVARVTLGQADILLDGTLHARRGRG